MEMYTIRVEYQVYLGKHIKRILYGAQHSYPNALYTIITNCVCGILNKNTRNAKLRIVDHKNDNPDETSTQKRDQMCETHDH